MRFNTALPSSTSNPLQEAWAKVEAYLDKDSGLVDQDLP